MKVKSLILLLVCILACSCNNKKEPSAETIASIMNEVETLQAQLPMDCGYGLTLTDINFNNDNQTIEYKFQFSQPILSGPTDESIKAAKDAAVAMLKADPKTKKVIEEGITFHYDYYSSEGDYLYSIDINEDDIR